MKNDMNLKDVAWAFDMTVEKLAKFMGYTRQGLYDAVSRNKRLRGGKYNAAIEKLSLLNEQMTQVEKETALRNYEKRKNAILALSVVVQKEGGQ